MLGLRGTTFLHLWDGSGEAMDAQLVGLDDFGEAFGQEGSDISAKSLDEAEIDGKAMGDDPARRNSLVREPQRRAVRAVKAHA